MSTITASLLRKSERFPDEHLRRPADQGFIIEADNGAALKCATAKPSPKCPLEESRSPLNSLDAPDKQDLGILQRLDILKILNLRIDHPDVRQTRIDQEAEVCVMIPAKIADC